MFLGILLVGVLFIPATMAALGIGSLAGEYDEATSTWFSIHLTGIVIVGVVWYLGLRRQRTPVALLGLIPLRVPRVKTVLLTVGALAASLVATALYAMMMDSIGSDALSPPEIPSEITFPGPAVVFTFQALAMATPLTEEILYRGFIFPGLVPRLGPGWAIVASAVIFSVSHLHPGALVPIFVTGLLLAWLYWQTGSLWPSIFAHAGQNALVVAILAY